MTNEKLIAVVFLFCFFSVVSAQEMISDNDVAEMMNDKEFLQFLKTTGQAFSPALEPPAVNGEPAVRNNPATLSPFQQWRRHQIAENKRNRNTIGYKRRVYDFYVPGEKQPERSVSAGLKIDMRQGKLRETGGDFDLAIEGNGFFQVVDQETDQTLYTRSGSFEREPQGFLALIQGERVFRLMPEIAVPEEVDSVRVTETGQIFVTTEPEPGERSIGRLELAVFPNPKRLCPADDRCFAETALSGKPKIRVPSQKTAGKIRQRFLEESNVLQKY